MKRKLVLMLLMVIFTFVLAGCDFLGGNTTTTTTATDTQASTDTTTTTTTTNTSTTTSTTTTTTTTTTTSSGQVVTTTTTTTTSSGVTTTTTEVTTTTESTFDRQDLIDYFIDNATGETPTADEIEAQIDFYQDLFGVTSEEDLYYLLTGMTTVLSGLDLIETLQDARNWYQNAKALGFSREVIVHMMMKLIEQKINEEVLSYDASYYAGEIAALQTAIAANEQTMVTNRTNLVDYCTNQTSNVDTCTGFYDALVASYLANQAYWDEVDTSRWETYRNDWDQDKLNDILWNIDSVLYYTYEYVDTAKQEMYQAAVDELTNALSPSESAMYQNAITLYTAYQTIEYRDVRQYEHVVYQLQDNNDSNLGNKVRDFYGYYQDAANQKNSNEYYIYELQQEQLRAQEQHQVMVAFQGYMNSTAGKAKVELLMMTIYDILDHVIMNLSEDTFNFVLNLLQGNVALTQDDLTSENILLYTGMVKEVLTLLRATLTVEDMDNIASIAKDIFGMYILTQDLTPAEIAAVTVNVNAAIDQYGPMILSTIDDVIAFLDSINQTKADAIINFVTFIQSDMFTQEEVVIEIASLMTVILGDNDLDVAGLLSNMTEIYFDVQYGFFPDEDTVILVKTAISENVARIIELAGIVKDYDSNNLTMDQMLEIEELMARVEAITMMFKGGFEQILNPIKFGYETEDFYILIQQLEGREMTDEELNAQILLFEQLFGLTDEQETYYMITSVLGLVQQVQSFTTITEFQTWFARVHELGFSNTAIAGYIFNFGLIKLNQDLVNGVNSGEIDYWTGEVEYYQQMIDDYDSYFNQIDQLIAADIAALSPELQQTAIDYWNAKLQYFIYYNHANDLVNDAMNSIDYWILDGILSSHDNYLYYLSISDGFNANMMDQNFHQLYDPLDSMQKALIDELLTARDLKNNYYTNTIVPLEDILYANQAYQTFISDVMNNAYMYQSNLQNISWYQSMIDDATSRIAELQMNQASEALLIQDYIDYLSDPTNEQLVKNLIAALLDDGEAILNSMDPATFDLLLQLLMGQSKTDSEYTVYSDTGMTNPLEGIDLSTEAIISYLQDFSVVIETMITNLDSNEVDMIKTVLFDVLEIQLLHEGMLQAEVDETITLYSSLFDFIYLVATESVGSITYTIDHMTVENLQLIIDNIGVLTDETTSVTAKVTAVSTVITTLSDINPDLYNVFVENAIQALFVSGYVFLYSPSEATAFINYVIENGITREEAADNLVDFFVIFANQQLSEYSTISIYDDLQASLDEYQVARDAAIQEVSDIDTDVAYEIALITDPTANGLASSLWTQAIALNQLEDVYNNMYSDATYSWYFNEYTYQELFLYRFGDDKGTAPDMVAYENLWNMQYPEYQQVYGPLLDKWQEFVDAFALYQTDETSLEAYHIYISDTVTYIEVYLHNQRFLRLTAANDVAYYQYQMDVTAISMMDYEQDYRLETVLTSLIDDEMNVQLMKDVVLILFDEVANFASSLTQEQLIQLVSMIETFSQTEGLPAAADMTQFINLVGEIISPLTTTLTAEELDQVSTLIQKIVFSYINAFGDSEATALEAATIIDTYFSDVVLLIPTLSMVLQNATEARVQEIIDQQAIIQAVDGQDDDLSNQIRAIAIANLINAVLVDETIDPDALIATVFGAVFDTQYLMGYEDLSTTVDKVTALQDAFGDVVVSGTVILEYDSSNLTAEQITNINIYHSDVEALIALMDQYFPSGNN
ncbi:MAG: hypothetical protein AB7U79_01375 [Candidatus Izemoplasmatales bacterium]